MWGIHSQEAFRASVILSLEKRRTLGGCAQGSTPAIATLMMGMDRRVLRSLAERGTAMFENQLLFLIRLGDLAPLFLTALPFVFSLLPEHLLAEVMFTSPPQWGEHGGNWTYKKHNGIKTQALFKHLQCRCHPYLVHKPSERRGFSGIWPGPKGSSRWALGSLIFLWAQM